MNFDIEESRQIAIRVPELRKKELTAKLTFAEQNELNQMMAIKAERYPDLTEQQYAENVKLTAIRNFTIKEVTKKGSLFQKLLKQENRKEFRMQILNEDEDVSYYILQFTFALELRQLMEDVGLGLDWPKMLPVDDCLSYTDPLEEDDKEWFEAFPNPAWCAVRLNEARDIEGKAAAHSKEMVQAIDWLKTHWENGFYIYADIDPIEDDE
ncbi:hypothetical protein NSQ43_05105 [Sporosarcina sp. FSL W8-0480]|uniref:hypothetical protein n=1 Tax=Sporosarcina sp. FSL W8-0480 TaxID=2954701 RepID=UPI0030DB6294